MQAYFADVQNMDAELYHLPTDEIRSSHAYYKEDQFNSCATYYEEALDSLHKMIAELESTALLHQPILHSATKVVERYHIYRNSNYRLLTFEKWETFRDRFTSMIIDDQVLSNVEPLHFLCSVLSGEANKTIDHLL